ncbi:hypothetical protein LOTGIDRAFT_176120, partial [Lottia gigantea]
TNSFTVQKLLEGNEYYFRVSAENEVGVSEPAVILEGIVAKSPYDVPSEPRKFQPTEVTKSSVTLTWVPPENDGGSPVTGYLIEKKTKTSPRWTKCNKSPVRDTIYTVTDLIENDDYEFRIMAENAAGAGKATQAIGPIKAKDPFAAPSAPIGPLEVTDIQRDNATIAWKAPEDDGGSPITGYIIEKRDTKRNNWSKVGKAPAGSTEYNVPGLIEGTSYYFRVIAENKAGQSDPLETEKPVTAKSPFDKPGKPVGPIIIDNVTNDSADLEWKAPETDGGSPLTAYIIEVRPTSRSTWTKSGRVDGQTTKFTALDLKEGNEYLFRITAMNAEGQSEPLESKDTVKITKKILPPGQVRNLKPVKVGQNYVFLEWKAPVEDGGSKITSYKIEKSDAKTDQWVKIAEIKAYDNQYKISDLTENLEYYFAVSAGNEAGFGIPEETDSAITPKRPEGPPQKPVGPLTISDVDRTSATLSWKPPTDDGGSPITGYVVERKEVRRPSWTTMDHVDAETTEYKAMNLIESTEYYFRVIAQNKHGASEPLETETTIKPTSGFDVPSRPTGPLVVDNVTENSADLTWKAPESDGGLPLKSYIIEMRPSTKSVWDQVGSVDGQTTEFTVPDLKPGSEYHFRVIAVNDEGQSPALEAKQTAEPKKKIVAPEAPKQLKISKVGDDFVLLDWKPPADNGGSKVTGYKIEKCDEKSDKWVTVEEVKAYDTSYKVTGLKEGKGYLFAVSAKNEIGYGEPVETDKAVKPKRKECPPSKPTGPIKTIDIDRTEVTLEWKEPKDDGGSPLTGYIIEKREAKKSLWTKVEKIGPDATIYKVTGLAEGTDYQFKISAENKVGVSEPLETETAVKAKGKFDVPSKPGGPLTIDNVTDQTADLTWKAPESDGGLPLKSYIIEMRPSTKSVWSPVGSVDADKTEFTVGDLKPGNEYLFRVIAVNDEGKSEPLETKQTAEPKKKIVAPDAPKSLKVSKVGDDFVLLDWKVPENNGGSKVTGYKIEKCEEKSDKWVTVEEVKGYDTSYKVTGLKEGTGYLFAVSAKNEIGYGEPVETDKAVKPKRKETAPSKPTGPIKTIDIDRTEVTLEWKEPKDDGGSPLTGYIIEKREAKKGIWSKVEKISPEKTVYKISNLIEDTEYHFKISAENKIGTSEPLETDKPIKAKSKFDKPSKPGGPLTIDNVTDQTADLTWKAPESDGGLPLKSYIIEMRPSTKSVWSPVGSVDADKTEFTVGDLKPGNEYLFRVIAVNDEGKSEPLETKQTAEPKKKIVAPDAPKSLKVSKVGDDFVLLDWKVPENNGGSKVTGYKIEKCEEKSDKWVTVEEVKGYDTSYKVTDLKEGTGYLFAVSAKNEIGYGEPVETDKAVKPKRKEAAPSKPTGPIKTIDIDRTEVTLEWKEPKDDGGSPLTGYIIEKREAKKGIWTKVEKISPEKTVYKISNLIEDTEYHFKILAENKIGTSEPLETDKPIKAKSKFDKPSKPGGPLTIDNVTDQTADLTWKAPESDGGLPLKSYIIEMRPSTKSVWSPVGSVDADKTEFTVGDLKPGNEYLFRVIAVNDEGKSEPLETKQTAEPKKKINPPEAPKQLKVAKVGQDFVLLDWKAPTEDGGSKVTGYKIEKCDEKSDKWVKVDEVKGYDTQFK